MNIDSSHSNYSSNFDNHNIFEDTLISQGIRPFGKRSGNNRSDPSFMQEAYLQTNGYMPEFNIRVIVPRNRATSALMPVADMWYKASAPAEIMTYKLQNFINRELVNSAQQLAIQESKSLGVPVGKNTLIEPVYQEYRKTSDGRGYEVDFIIFVKDL